MNAAAAVPSGLTRSTEDYLKAIYGLAQAGEAVQTSAIAEALEVAPASVSGMLRRLAEHDLIAHERYRGVQLTEQGRAAALRVVRRHRILESYLTSRLGYDWDNVHQEAERLEHAASDELIDHMAAALGDPRYDPHGAPIPTPEGHIETPNVVALTEIVAGRRAQFRMVSDKDPDRLRYIASLGLHVGSEFEVVDVQPFRGPVTIQLATAAGGRQVVGYELAQLLRCSVLGDEVDHG